MGGVRSMMTYIGAAHLKEVQQAHDLRPRHRADQRRVRERVTDGEPAAYCICVLGDRPAALFAFAAAARRAAWRPSAAHWRSDSASS